MFCKRRIEQSLSFSFLFGKLTFVTRFGSSRSDKCGWQIKNENLGYGVLGSVRFCDKSDLLKRQCCASMHVTLLYICRRTRTFEHAQIDQSRSSLILCSLTPQWPRQKSKTLSRKWRVDQVFMRPSDPSDLRPQACEVLRSSK